MTDQCEIVNKNQTTAQSGKRFWFNGCFSECVRHCLYSSYTLSAFSGSLGDIWLTFTVVAGEDEAALSYVRGIDLHCVKQEKADSGISISHAILAPALHHMVIVLLASGLPVDL